MSFAEAYRAARRIATTKAGAGTVGAVLAVLAITGQLHAQRAPGRAAPFTVPVYDRDNPNRMVALLSGAIAEFQLSGRQPLTTVRVEYYDEKGHTNLVFEGTNCVYDARRRMAESSGPLRVVTGDGRLDLEGEGFTWWQTNNDFTISNRVTTRVRRPATPGATPDSHAGEGLRVTSDRFWFSYPSNRILYSGRVQVDDPRLQLTCGRLTILRSAAGGIERMLAEEEVVMIDRLGGGRVTARQADYRVDDERETVELTGNPRFQEGVREGTADRFLLDRRADTLHALGAARMVFPVGDRGAPGLPALAASGTRPAGETNRLIELSAAAITIGLPPTNGPVRSVVAETNVVILDPHQNAKATAQRASYREDSGLELSGNPVWSSGGQRLEGELMRYDLSDQAFRVTGGAQVRLPVQSLRGPLRSIEGAMPQTDAMAGSNQVVTIRSRSLHYRDPWLRFEENARADFLEGDVRLGTLQCATLSLRHSNVVQEVRAVGGVQLDQLPVPQRDGGSISRAVRAETLVVGFDAEGQLESLAASGGVDACQTEAQPGSRPPIVKRVTSETVDARFWGRSNLVAWATAEGRVVVSQGDRVVQAERAFYTGTNSLLQLVGHPTIILPEGRITEADVISWNQATGQYRISGRFKSHWKSLPGVTNLATLPRIP